MASKWQGVFHIKIFFIPIWVKVSELNYYKARATWWLDTKRDLVRRK